MGELIPGAHARRAPASAAPARRAGAAVALVVIAVLALATAACAGSTTATHAALRDPAIAPAAVDEAAAAAQPTNEPRLWIQDRGETLPFENGRSVTAGGMDVEIYIAPYPPGRSATMDFYVTRNGTPVDGATVTLRYDMTLMEHGPFRLSATPTGRGHYLAPLEFDMTGDFWLNVAVDGGGAEGLIHLIVRAIR